jgi:spore germination cell wall hydrolase CwlJ-like protein
MAKNWITGIFALVIIVFMARVETKLEKLGTDVADLHAIVRTAEPVAINDRDIECLTKNIYYEAGIEDRTGKYAVGHITMNRVNAGHWGKSVCDVVYSKNQFSWTRIKKLHKPDREKWNESLMVAYDVLKGYRVKALDNSLFYHADYIKTPHWVDPKKQVTQIGRHIFYTKARSI